MLPWPGLVQYPRYPLLSPSQIEPAQGRSLKRNLIYPVLAICGIGWFGLIGMIYVASVGQNQVALQESKRLVRALLDVEARQMRQLAKDYTWWDDSIRNLLVDFDAEWAGGNVGWYLYDNFRVAQTVVLAGDDRVIYAQRDGEWLETATLADVHGEVLLPLARRARASEGRRESPRDEGPEPVPVSGFVEAGGEIWVVGASVLTTEGLDSSPELPDPGATLILAKRLDADLLNELSEGFGLPNLSLVPPAAAVESSVPISGNGRVLARVSWQPKLPGSRLLSYVVPAACGGALLTLGLLGAFLRHSQRAADELEASARALAAQHALVLERERDLRALVDNVADGIVAADADGKVISFNPSASRILGWAEAEAQGQAILPLLLGPAAEAGAEDLPERLRRLSGQSVTGRRRDGSQFVMELSASRGGNGEKGHHIVVVRDIGERLRAQATLNLLATPMIVLDGDLRPALCNASAQGLLRGGDGMELRDGRLHLWQPGEMTQCRRLVWAAMGLGEEGLPDTGVMTVSRPSGKQSLAMMVTALRSADAAAATPLAAVFLRDPEHRWEVPPKVLQELYELTPAESRVAIELVNGSSPKEVARTFNVSVNTVRNQIKQAYRKTGTSRQSQLVALMLSTAALVSDRLDDAA